MTNDAALDDEVAAAAFRRLLGHLRHRSDAQNVDLMGLAGFCRNCLADWVAEAAAERGRPIDREEARTLVYGMPYAEWKANQPPATPEQLARMEESVARNQGGQTTRQTQSLMPSAQRSPVHRKSARLSQS